MREEDQHYLEKFLNVTGHTIIIPDYGTLQANKHAYLPLTSTLSPAEIIATIVPGLNSSSLLSMGQLCDNGCNVLLNKHNIYAINDKEVSIEGERNHRNGLWGNIILSRTKNKMSVQTNNYPTIASHASLYKSTTKYKRQQILSMDVQKPECTQQSPISYIQEFGAMDVLIDDNWDNNYIKQQI